MISEFKKSTNSIFYERMTSPLFGSFFISWIIWNWKIIYLTFFVDTDTIDKNKLDYILEKLYSTDHLIYYPLISTLILILILPFFSVGAFYISLKFKNWKKNIRNEMENKLLLTVEESIELREEISQQENKFIELLENKDRDIKNLELVVEKLSSEKTKEFNDNKIEKTDLDEKKLKREYEKLKSNPKLFEQFYIISPRAQGGYTMFTDNNRELIDRQMFDYFLANDILKKEKSNLYNFTEKGKLFNKFRLDEEFLNKNH